MQKRSFIKIASLALMIGLMSSTAFVSTADAKDRNRSGSVTTGSGKTGIYSGQKTGNLKDGVNRTQTVTGPNGQTKTRNATTTYDQETGAFNKTVTGANGQTRAYTGTAGDGQRSGTYTTGNGQSGTFEGTAQKNEDGTYTRQGSWTNQDGETKTRSVTGGYDKETDTATRTITNNQGKTRTGSVTVTPYNQ
jgi:hypothetical protein